MEPDFPIIYLGNNGADAVGEAVGMDEFTHEPGGFRALADRARSRAYVPDERADAYSVHAVGSCITGIGEDMRLEARPYEILQPFGLCILALKGADISSGKIFLGYVHGAEIRPGEKESGVIVAQTNPPAVFFAPISQIAALHRLVCLDGPAIEFVDSLEQFVDAGLVAVPTAPIGLEWRPWTATEAAHAV